jgi:hypothetical protein
VILDRDGQAPHSGIEGRSLRDGPGAQHLAGLEAQVEVERRRVMQLHDESRGRHKATAASGRRRRYTEDIALLNKHERTGPDPDKFDGR